MTPRVTVGIPVYNGEKYLAEAIESVLAQTFTDFELVISDNASTDATAAIALEYAARDPRVRYSRNRENIGSARNFGRVFELATGEFFKWMASDDLISPGFLENCVVALDREPAAVLAYTRGTGIDANGEVLKHCEHPVAIEAQADPVKRFRLFRERSGFSAWPFLYIFGLMRREVLAQTRLQGPYMGSDNSCIYEMLFAGRFVEVPLHLSAFRLHESSFTSSTDTRSKIKFMEGRDSWLKAFIGYKRLYFEYLVNIARARLTPGQKLAILWANLTWALTERGSKTVPEQSLLAPVTR
jgi:glycosyltransferase involved in cell wall biosynthesis